MRVVIVEYNAGNIQSVSFALQRLGISPEITNDHKIISAADKVIFPGVGEASTAMRYLRSKGLDKVIKGLNQPLLGICLGLQLLCKSSEENSTECLGVFEGEVIKFISPKEQRFKIPHVGWNDIFNLKGKLFENVPEKSQLYFVHSYCAKINQHTAAVCAYASEFSAAMEKDNFFAVQFHPEKSGEVGAQILRNFINL